MSMGVCVCVLSSSSPSFKMSARKLHTSKEWSENSPDLVYHQLHGSSYVRCAMIRNGPSSVYTINRSGLLYRSSFCYEYNYGISLPNRRSKIRQMPLLEQSAKYSSRQNFRPYGMCVRGVRVGPNVHGCVVCVLSRLMHSSCVRPLLIPLPHYLVCITHPHSSYTTKCATCTSSLSHPL